jgi:alcohol dehydrogenase class IV
MDALSHALESYTSRLPSPLADGLNETAFASIRLNLLEGYARRSSRAMANLLLASTMAGIAIGNTRGGLVHAMSHPITAHAGTPHGVANAILMAPIVRYNALGAVERYSRVAQLLEPERWGSTVSLDAAYGAADAIDRLRAALEIPPMLSDVGMRREMIAPVLDETMKGFQLPINARDVTRQGALKILSDLVSAAPHDVSTKTNRDSADHEN